MILYFENGSDRAVRKSCIQVCLRCVSLLLLDLLHLPADADKSFRHTPVTFSGVNRSTEYDLNQKRNVGFMKIGSRFDPVISESSGSFKQRSIKWESLCDFNMKPR